MSVNHRVEGRSVVLQFSEAIYPLEAVMKTAYTFIDRFYVLVDDPEPGRFTVSLTTKSDTVNPEGCAGEFDNELLNQALRLRLSRETKALREMIVGRALLACQPVTDEQTQGEDTIYIPCPEDVRGQAEEEDVLGIARKWRSNER